MAEERPDEIKVRQILSGILSLPVERHDDGSRASMFDAKVVLLDGSIEAVEIVSDMDRDKRQRMAAARRMPVRHTDTTLTHGWRVTISNRAKIRETERLLLPAIHGLEAASVSSAGHDDSTTSKALRDAGIDHAEIDSSVPPGTVLVFSGLVDVGSVMDPRRLHDYVTEFFAIPDHDDVRRKLGASGVKTTHAVIHVSPDNMGVMMSLDPHETGLPLTDPSVPQEISCVWLVPMWPGDRVIRWCRDEGWKQVGYTPED